MTTLKQLSDSFRRTGEYELKTFEKEFPSTLKERKSMSALKVVRGELEQIWEKILRKHDALIESPLFDDPEEQKTIDIIAIQEQFKRNRKFYRETLITIDETIDALGEVLRRSDKSPSRELERSSAFKVAPCDIDPFNGEYASWATFRDMFTSMYGRNSRLTGVEKLYYLRQKTHGEANEIVCNAPLTNDGFLIAWENLREQYENARMQVNAQIKILLNLPSVSNHCGSSVRKLQRIINGCIDQLKSLKVKTEHWGPILVYLCSSKLPVETLTKFEETLTDTSTTPAWIEMDAFLTNTYKGLESVADIKNFDIHAENGKKGKTFHANVSRTNKKDSRTVAKPVGNTAKSFPTNPPDYKAVGPVCKFCEEGHSIRECSEFCKLNVYERIEFVRKSDCCYNCLAVSHTINECKSAFSCRLCGKRHNTLLHKPLSSTNTRLDNDNPSSSNPNISSQAFSTLTQSNTILDERKRLLGTAMLQVDLYGSLFSARALIDPASDFSFISDSLRHRLNVPTTPISAEISGLNEVVSAKSDKLCEVILRSNTQTDFTLKIQAIVVKTLTQALPTQSIEISRFQTFDNIRLADPNFYESRPIDFLIGSDYYPEIIRCGVKKNVDNTLVAQDTEFGWILTGPVNENLLRRKVVSYHNAVTLEKSITKFWEMEELPKKLPRSEEDRICEQLYKQTTLRLPNGRYQVSLPFRTSQTNLGNSRHIAMAQFLRNEKNLMKTPQLKLEYDQALQEYIDLDHMKPVYYYPNSSSNDHFYLPHHAVVKPDRVTTKVRVVFNASSKTTTGQSLNDMLFTGPTLQRDLVVLILQWRFFRIVFNADIQKMYRQILLDPTHTQYQRILYRKNVNEPIQDYELKTVTFGINSAPYLAIRSLHRLAEDVQFTHPLVSNILRNFMYVDDILGGTHTIEDAKNVQIQLISALDSVGFPLRKWISNTTEVLNHLPKGHLLNENLLSLTESSNAKTLGIRWNAKTDTFFFDVPSIEQNRNYTKRNVLSDIARLFDPAGWLAPIIVAAKIIMQQVWEDKINWDDCLKPITLHKWQSFLKTYEQINQIQIPRWIKYVPTSEIEFHGFSDASEKAYSAVLYARVIPKNGPISVTLLFAKTRVAPIKVISLPKLELCGAVLLATMVENVLSQLELPQHTKHFWTDSSIVLAWLNKPPNLWNTFVANRLTIITDSVGNKNWSHVISQDNPADIASRGCDAETLKTDTLWWHGPSWLAMDRSSWPKQKIFTTQTEAKSIKTFTNAVTTHTDVLERFSKLSTALRVLTYVYRFYHHTSPNHKNAFQRPHRELEADEIKFTKDRLMKLCQMQHFNDEYVNLRNSINLPSKSTLLTLAPFLDANGIIRANGRLISSENLSYNETHPILLPYNSKFTRLLVEHVHFVTLHGGNQLMVRVIRSGYWIPKLKNLVRTIIHSCVPCTKHRNKQASQLMAALPPERTRISRPFTNVGVDFAGPLEVKSFSGRCCKITKGYVCLFVCFSTKAIHLEAASELSSQAFMAAFARFFSRRGCPDALFSDNGTNFVGASKMIKKDRLEFIKTLQQSVTSNHEFQNLKWHFIPPGAPHMGGLWEAGVKSFKTHFKKITHTQKYTFEELLTLLTRIESCLNSRPLSPASEDSNDLNPLTPGHFLIGTPLLAPAEPDFYSQNICLVNRWQRLRVQHHIFCRRWKDEYLKELHKRYKWKHPQRSLQIDDMVVIKQDNTSPNEWQLGRVIKVYYGPDKRIRVVDLRTASGTITRPIAKLVVLPS